MRIKLPLLFIPALIAICLLSTATQSQVRRRKDRPTAPRVKIVPLTIEQKTAITELIEQAKLIDYNYKFGHDSILSIQASNVGGRAIELAASIPNGAIQNLLSVMGLAYRDAAVLYSAYTNHLIFYTQQDVMRVIERNKMQNLTPYAMVSRIFAAASLLKDAVNFILTKSPTFQPRIDLTQRGSSWTFPKPGMRGEYSDLTKTIMYDLGQGFFAGHIELVPGVPAVAMFFFVPIPKEEVSEEVSQADLALVFASKAVKLPKLLSDTILEKKKDSEYRFRTASGKVLIVALKDKEMAILRFE